MIDVELKEEPFRMIKLFSLHSSMNHLPLVSSEGSTDAGGNSFGREDKEPVELQRVEEESTDPRRACVVSMILAR